MPGKFIALAFLLIACIFVSQGQQFTFPGASKAGLGLLVEDYNSYLASELFTRTNVSVLTIGCWVKPTKATYIGELFHYFEEFNDAPVLGINWYPTLGALVTVRGFPQIPFGTGGPDGAEANLSMENTNWNHLAMTINFETGDMYLYHNATVMGKSLGNLISRYLPPVGRFSIGKALSPTYGARPQVILDQFFVVEKELNITEIEAMARQAPTDPEIVSKLLLYWNFDNVDEFSPYTISSAYGAPLTGRILGAPYRIDQGLANPVRPALVPSSAPFSGSTVFPYVRTGPTTDIDIVFGSASDSITIISLPSSDQIFRRTSGGQRTGAAITVSDLPLTVSIGVVYNGSFSEPKQTFSISINGVQHTVMLLQNSPPEVRNNVEAFATQGEATTLSVVGKVYYPPGSENVFDYYMADRDGDALSCILNSFAIDDGTLSTADGPISSTPVVLPNCEIIYTADTERFGSNLQNLSVTVSDGLQLTSSSLIISVPNSYIPTATKSQRIAIQENDRSTINFGESASSYQYQVPRQGPQINEPTFITITDFPKLVPLLPIREEWASSVLAVSSVYSGEAGAYGREQALGPPDVFPTYGDIPQAWAPSLPDEDEWIALNFPTAVYPARVEVYQTFFSGTLWRISALPEGANATTGWVLLWQTTARLTPQRTAIIVSPPLCPVTFKTKSILLEFKPAGPSAYIEVDAVKLAGYSELPTPDIVDLARGSVSFVPDLYANGNDSISYLVNRCANYAQYRTARAQAGTIPISIISVNQRPEFTNTIIFVDASNYTLDKNFGAQRTFVVPVVDVDAPSSSLTLSVSRLPQRGQLQVASGATVRDGDRFSGDTMFLYKTDSCRSSSSGLYNVSIGFVASDGSLSMSGDVVITVDCDGNVRKLSLGIEIAVYIVSALSSVVCIIYGILIVIWRHKKSIYSISPLFCLLTVAGAICANISPIFLTVSLSACMAWLAFLTIGVCIFFGALAAKTYRIDRIFHERSVRVFAIPNTLLFAVVGGLVLVQTIMLIIWGVVIPTSATLRPLENGQSGFAAMCFSTGTPIIQGVQYAFLSLLFVFAAVFAWRVRSIPLSEYKESREIFLATYQIGFVSLIAIPLASVFWYEPNASIIVTCVGTCFASTVSIAVLFSAKLSKIARGIDSDSSSASVQMSASKMASSKSN